MPQSFELLINIKNGNIAGGGLQRSGYVETHINGENAHHLLIQYTYRTYF